VFSTNIAAVITVHVLRVSEECLIENDIRSYSYLTNGYVPIITGEDDVELYRQVLEAMDVLGFTKDEQIGQFNHAYYITLELFRVA